MSSSENDLSSLEKKLSSASKRRLIKVVKSSQMGTSHSLPILDKSSDSLGFGTRFSILDFMNSSDSFSRIIDSLLDEFTGELIFLKSIPPGIDEADYDPEEEIHLIEKLLYDNSSPRLPKEFNSKNSDAVIESFSPSPILVEDSDSLMEEIDLSLTPDDSMPSSIENDDYDYEGISFSLKNCLAMIPFHFLKMSHFILMFHHPLVLLQNHQMMMKLSPLREF
uniref:Reverse transcriptase domain-containing protein n=1 Tax=Tanacetum cinerariifolium TaxID=118510 RepID=A0A6L2M3C7_TANCI|nr:hypothetical protein [Tanacetum cinerariifolium]